MRVALLTNFIPPYRVSLYRALAAEVGELRIFVSTGMEENRRWQPEWSDLDVVQQRTITLKRRWRTARFQEDYELHLPYDTIMQLRAWRPDVVVTSELGARSVQAVMYAKAARRPVVLWATLSDRLERDRDVLRRALRRVLVPQFGLVLVNGEAGARYMRSFGVPESALVQAPYTTDIRPFLALPLGRARTGARNILFAGSLTDRKGVSLLLDAAEQWARTHSQNTLRLTVVGDGPLRHDLQQRRFSGNLEVSLIGHVAYQDLPRWFAEADLLAFPSLGDEWGVVVNEALAAGVPVLGSAYSQAVTELVVDGRNGWTFKPRSTTEVYAVLSRALATDAAQLRRMAAAARASIADVTPELVAHRIAAALHEISKKV